MRGQARRFNFFRMLLEQAAQGHRAHAGQNHFGRRPQKQGTRSASAITQGGRGHAVLAARVHQLGTVQGRNDTLKTGLLHQLGHEGQALLQHGVPHADAMVQHDDARAQVVVRVGATLQQAGLDQRLHIAVAGRCRDLQGLNDGLGCPQWRLLAEQIKHTQHARQAGASFFFHTCGHVSAANSFGL